jgi:hypothetical protein
MPEERFSPAPPRRPPGTEVRPYTATANEAHLPAEEAKAGQDPRVPSTDADARRPRDPEAAAGQRPETPHAGMTVATAGLE